MAEDEGPRVSVVAYPRPDYDGEPWSHWGQAVVLADGRVVSAIGDHLGRGGDSYVFVYDPRTGAMTTVGNVAAALGHPPGSWGFGKIHGQMVATDDGAVWFATYWGTRKGLEFDEAYTGDWLFRLDPETFEMAPVMVPVPGHGIPSLAGDGRYLFGEAVDPHSEPLAGGLFVFDTWTDQVVEWLPDDRHARFRNVIVTDAGAMVAERGGALLAWAPGRGAMRATDIDLGDQLRASTGPTADGTVFAVTTSTDRLVAITAAGALRDLGQAPAYTASLALGPDDRTVYFVPGAHGGAPELNAPLVALDTATGTQTVVADLAEPVRRELGLHVGGSYSVAMDERRGVVHVGLNAGTDPDDPWGEVVQVSVEVGGAPAATKPATLVEATADFGAVEPLAGIRGHAIATADVNGDGWQDVFVGTFADRPTDTYAVRGATGPAPDRLLLGGPDGFTLDLAFEGRLARSAGAVFADLDGDDDPDLVVSRNVRNESAGTEIYRNDGGRLVSFAILDSTRGGRAIDVVDYDGDGLLDLFLVEDRWSGASSVLYRNLGDLSFADATAGAGLAVDVWGLGLGVADLNGDGDDDLVVGGSNRIFLGDGVGGFVEAAGAIPQWHYHGDEDDAAHVAIADLDRDGRPDIVIGQHYNSTIDFGEQVPVRLYLNRTDPGGPLLLDDVTEAAGLVGLPTKAPKVLIVDIDANGWLDIVTTASAEAGTRPAVFLGEGVIDGVARFAAPSGTGDRQYWIDAAAVDVDRDGDQDLFLVEWEPSLASPLLITDR